MPLLRIALGGTVTAIPVRYRGMTVPLDVITTSAGLTGSASFFQILYDIDSCSSRPLTMMAMTGAVGSDPPNTTPPEIVSRLLSDPSNFLYVDDNPMLMTAAGSWLDNLLSYVATLSTKNISYDPNNNNQPQPQNLNTLLRFSFRDTQYLSQPAGSVVDGGSPVIDLAQNGEYFDMALYPIRPQPLAPNPFTQPAEYPPLGDMGDKTLTQMRAWFCTAIFPSWAPGQADSAGTLLLSRLSRPTTVYVSFSPRFRQNTSSAFGSFQLEVI